MNVYKTAIDGVSLDKQIKESLLRGEFHCDLCVTYYISARLSRYVCFFCNFAAENPTYTMLGCIFIGKNQACDGV